MNTTKESNLKLDQQETKLLLSGRASPATWAMYSSNGYWKLARHLELLDNLIWKLVNRKIRRLLICMPPRHGKSMFVSQYLSSWWIGSFPEECVILTSYGADLATRWSRRAKETLEMCGEEVFGVTPQGSTDSWSIVGHLGEFKAAGVGGGVTGRGADLLLADDLLKNAEEARSEVVRESTWEWWLSTAYTRLEPNGVVIMIGTRWHLDDPIGRALKFAEENPDTPQWTIFNFPAIAEENEPAWPVSLGRKKGKALWPERYDEMALDDIKLTLGNAWWLALYQQRPVPLGGGIFKSIFFNDRVPAAPYQAKRVRYWDIAASSKDSACYTVGTLMSYLDGIAYVEHVERGQWEPGERDQYMLSAAHKDRDRYGPNYAPLIYIEKQPAAAGIDLHRHFLRLLAGFPVFEDKPGSSKEVRAEPFASQCAGGNVKLVNDGSWKIGPWIEELCSFPMGALADQVDSASGGYSILANMRPAGSLRTYTTSAANKEKTIRIVCMSKKALALEIIDEHRCILISISRPEPAGKMEMPQHGINRLIDHTELAFLDKQATDFQQFWNSPIHPYDKLPKDLVMGRDMGKKLWSCLFRKRQEEIDVVVIADDGEDDRRGLSIAYAICDVLRLPKVRTIFRLEHPDWHAEEGKLPEKDIFNSHIYSAAKEGRNQIVEGKLLYGMRLAKEGGYGTFK